MSRSMTRTFFFVFAITFGVLLFVNWPQLGDPFIRHDDYPAFFRQDALYYEKTLSEGRWLNYLWMSYAPIWPSNLAFQFYLIGWAVFCAATACVVFGPSVPLSVVGLAAVLLALSPQAFLISAWFNTLGLAVWILAFYALSVLYVSERNARLALLVIGPISMLAYTTYPLLMSLLLFAHRDAKRSLRGAVTLLALLAFTIILGLVLMYSINQVVHGVFGLQISDWREPTPASDVDSLIANAHILTAFFENFVVSLGFGMPWLGAINVMLFAGAMAVVYRHDQMEALYLTLGLAASIGVLVVNGVKEGVEIPVRAALGAWGFYAITLVRAVHLLTEQRQTQIVVLCTAMFATFCAGHLHKNTRLLVDWQVETRALATQLPEGAEQIAIYGFLWAFPGAEDARITHYYALTARLTQLTGRPSVYCDDPEIECSFQPPFAQDEANDTTRIERVGTIVYIRLPDQQPDQWHPQQEDEVLDTTAQADIRTSKSGS